MYDCIVIGAGIAGSTVARRFADANKSVLLIDKRNHTGGNVYENYSQNGIRVHRYGPHIFHTNHKDVVDFLSRFCSFYEYKHKVQGLIDGYLVPIPFNFQSIDTLYSEKEGALIKKKLKEYFKETKVSILDLLSHPDKTIKSFGEFVYEKVFVHYTAKQWGTTIDKVDKSVINRVPVVLSYEDGYFHDEYQLMPEEGFSKLVDGMLDSDKIDLLLNTNAQDVFEFREDGIYYKGEKVNCPVIYTGAIDELLSYRFGILPYRSLNLVFEDMEIPAFQPVSVVNFPNSEDFTRITEFKHLTKQISSVTTILKEYPAKYDIRADIGNIPYYSIENAENRAIHDEYRKYLEKYPNFKLLGRLAEYKYYNIDVSVKRALELSDQLL